MHSLTSLNLLMYLPREFAKLDIYFFSTNIEKQTYRTYRNIEIWIL